MTTSLRTKTLYSVSAVLFTSILLSNNAFAVPPAITSPTPGSTITTTSATFSWSANSETIYEWWLYAASFFSGSNYFDSGSMSSSTTSRLVTGLPGNGSVIYVRFWFRTISSSGPWNYIDYTYPNPSPPSPPTYAPLARTIDATHVGVYFINLVANETYTIEVDSLDSGEDTVLHLLNPNDREVAQDDDGGDGLASKIVYTVPSGASGLYQIVLRAFQPYEGGDGAETQGEADWSVSNSSGVIVSETSRFAGHMVQVSGAMWNLDMHTVLMRDGTPDPTLHLLQWNDTTDQYEMIAFDDDSAADYAALVNTSSYVSPWNPYFQVLISTYKSTTEEGNVKLYLNLVGATGNHDLDGDKLSNHLEQELQTCWNPNAACSYSPHENAQDTDGDGIPDNWEVLGRIDTYPYGIDEVMDHFPQLLPKWGANPRHKDVFVQVDHKTGTYELPNDAGIGTRVINRMSEQTANDAAARYASLPVTNPDGVNGISVHFDIGQSCTGTGSSMTDICGNFCARADDLTLKFCGEQQGDEFDVGDDHYVDEMHENRKGIFHRLVSDSALTGGVVSGGLPNIDFRAQTSNFEAIAHELGHNLGLDHGGDPALINPNCHVNYPSIMNYLYEYSHGVALNHQFSNGKLGILDPSALSESFSYGSDADNLAFLEAIPVKYTLHNCQYNVNGVKRGCQVDWNRDGEITSGLVRARLSPGPYDKGICGGEHGNTAYVEDLRLLAPLTTQGAAGAIQSTVDGTFLHVFINVSNFLWYTSTLQTTGGWPLYIPVPSQGGLRTDAQPAAETFNDKVFVFGTDNSSAPIHYKTLSYVNHQFVWSSTWDAIPNQPTGMSIRDVSVAVFDDKLWIFAKDLNDTGNKIYFTTMNSSETWSGVWSTVQISGIPVQCSSTPGITPGPDDYLYFGCGNPIISPPNQNILTLYRMNTAGVWFSLNSLLRQAGDTRYISNSRPSMRYMPHLTGILRNPTSNGRGYLTVWYENHAVGSAVGTSPRSLYFDTWGKFSSTEFDITLGRTHRYEAKGYERLYSNSDKTNYTDVATPHIVKTPDHRLAALLTHGDGGEHPLGTPIIPGTIRHVPFAEGFGPSMLMMDTNDGQIMNNNLCKSLNCLAVCLDFSPQYASGAAYCRMTPIYEGSFSTEGNCPGSDE